MKGRISWCGGIFALLFVVFFTEPASAQGRHFTISLKGNLTTGTQLFPRPNSTNSAERASFFPIENIPGIGIEVRYRIPETNLALGLSADYIRGSISQTLAGFSRPIPVEDGYRVIPVELTGYFIIPFSGETFGVYMGGGGGAYFGRRILKIAGLESVPLDQGVGYGIHVLGGVSYRLVEWLTLEGEMKFRDVQFDATNAFLASSTIYQGTVVNISRDPRPSRVHTDGIIFQLGVAVAF